IVLAKLSGGSADRIDVRLSWTGAGAAQALERTASGTGVPLQSLLGRQWVLLKIHGMLAALRAHEDPATLDALKALATENRVVTPYTSLLVVIPRTDPGSTEASPAAADRALPASGEACLPLPRPRAVGGRSASSRRSKSRAGRRRPFGRTWRTPSSRTTNSTAGSSRALRKTNGSIRRPPSSDSRGRTSACWRSGTSSLGSFR